MTNLLHPESTMTLQSFAHSGSSSFVFGMTQPGLALLALELATLDLLLFPKLSARPDASIFALDLLHLETVLLSHSCV